IDSAEEYSNMGLIPAGAYKNRDFFVERASISEQIPAFFNDILFDPQTSGGLLISVAEEDSHLVLDNLINSPVAFGCIGKVEVFSEKYVIVE
ncbi:MAG: selenide, water dikinase SelD, partial [Synergistaceae bacterium]|nr:selenide, water dikinase SelD [Synergistaceae bacterium]